MDGFCFILHQNIHYPIGHLKGHRPNFLRCVYAQPAAFDHGRPTHGDSRILGCDDHVTAGEQRGVACETPPMIHPYQGHGAGKLRKSREGRGVEGHRRSGAVVPWTTTTTFTEQNQRNAPAQSQLKHAILLVVVASPLCARENGVVVVHDHGSRGFVTEQICIHSACTGYHAVSRRTLTQ